MIRYTNRLGIAKEINEVMCRCSHPAHRQRACPIFGCGCQRYRPVTIPEANDAA